MENAAQLAIHGAVFCILWVRVTVPEVVNHREARPAGSQSHADVPFAWAALTPTTSPLRAGSGRGSSTP